MDNPRPDKVAVVDEVRDKIDSSSAVLLTEYRGLSVGALAQLRTTLRDVGGEYKVYKNTLVRLAARELDLEIEDLLTGPTAIAFVGDRPDGTPGDAVLVAKALQAFAKANPAMVIKGGVLGESLLDSTGAKALAEVAPRDELLARFAGLLAAPLQQFAGLLQALPRNLAYGLQGLIDKAVAEGATPPPAAGSPADEAVPDQVPQADTPDPEGTPSPEASVASDSAPAPEPAAAAEAPDAETPDAETPDAAPAEAAAPSETDTDTVTEPDTTIEAAAPAAGEATEAVPTEEES